MSRDIFSQIRLLRAPSNPTLNVSKNGTSTLSGQPVQVFHHPHWKIFLPYIQSKSTFFNCPIITGPAKKPVSIFLISPTLRSITWECQKSQNWENEKRQQDKAQQYWSPSRAALRKPFSNVVSYHSEPEERQVFGYRCMTNQWRRA